jgi:hypothetical protein
MSHLDYQDTMLGILNQYLFNDIFDLVYRDHYNRVINQLDQMSVELFNRAFFPAWVRFNKRGGQY